MITYVLYTLVFGLRPLFCHGMIGMLVYPLPGFSLVFLLYCYFSLRYDLGFLACCNKSIKFLNSSDCP